MKVTLRAARVNVGLTLIDAAERLDINKDTLSKYQKDSTDIPRSLVIGIEELYCVEANNIFFGVESEFFRMSEKGRKKSRSHYDPLST